MTMIEVLLKEVEQEALTTRKMLERVPADKFGWKPHEKSMDLKTLSAHIAELASWISMGFNTSELDFAVNPYVPAEAKATSDLLALFEQSLDGARKSLIDANEEDLEPSWTLRNGEEIYAVMTKAELIRHSISQTIHHRAQLGVYLRLLNIPIPGSYGPSADEMEF